MPSIVSKRNFKTIYVRIRGITTSIPETKYFFISPLIPAIGNNLTCYNYNYLSDFIGKVSECQVELKLVYGINPKELEKEDVKLKIGSGYKPNRITPITPIISTVKDGREKVILYGEGSFEKYICLITLA